MGTNDFYFFRKKEEKNELNPILIYFINSFAINYNSIRRQNSKSFFLEPYEEKASYTFLGGVLFIYIYPNEPSIESLQLMFDPEEKEEIFGT